MELHPPFTIKTYTVFQDLYITVNIYISKQDYTIMIEHSKKNKKYKLQKIQMEYDKEDIFKAKRFRKKEMITKKDECSFMIIVT